MADLIWWMGATTTTTSRVVVRSDTDGLITLTCNGQVYSDTAATATLDGIVTFDITGLSADTSYPTTITHADATSETGTIKTMLASGDFYITWASCLSNAIDIKHHVKHILNLGSRCHLNLGDLFYSNGGGPNFDESPADGDTNQTTSNYYAFHRMPRRSPGRAELMHNIPFLVMGDDHEWHGDNWDHTGTHCNILGAGLADQAAVDAAWNTENLAMVAYSAGNPDNSDAEAVAEKPSDHERAALADFGVITASAANYPVRYFRFTIGNAEFFVLDCMSYRSALASTDGVNKTMLGANQKAWLKARLSASTATFKVILTPKKLFRATGNDNGDIFEHPTEGYMTERDELLSYIHTNLIRGVIWLAGDRHTPSVGTATEAVDGWDAVCVCGCPMGVDTNSPIGTTNANEIMIGETWQHVFGALKVTSSYMEAQIRSARNSNVLWRGRVNAETNYLSYPELQVAI